MIAPTRDRLTAPGEPHPHGPPPHTGPDDPEPTGRADEAALVRRARAGEAAAFEGIVRRHERPIYAFVYRLMGDADDATDLSQDCFARAYRALGATNEALNVSAWLHRIAANACLDVLRRRQRLRWLPWSEAKHDHLLLGGPADDPERRAISHQTRLVVRRVLERMSRRHRLGLLLREYEGLSCAEIGQAMGLSRSATKSMLYRAGEAFRVCVEAERDPSAAEDPTGPSARRNTRGGPP